MYKSMVKKSKKMRNIAFIFVCILLLCISFSFGRKITFVENALKEVSNFFNVILFSPVKLYNSEKDIDQSESYLIQKNINESLEKEIEELKDALDLNRTITEYNVVNATILSRNKSYWFNTITIDKGKKAGIKEGMAVITKNGLIGKVSKVYSSSSEIKLITSDDTNYKVSVSIKANDRETIAILNGYDKKNELIKIVGVDKNIKLEKGDEVLTSGLGGVFPGGIFVGNVEKYESDKYNLSNTIYIKTRQDFNSIHYVSILVSK